MAETEDSQTNIAAIRTRLDNLERMTRLAIAANPNSQSHIEQILLDRAGSAEVYLALANGPKSQEELVVLVAKSQPTVSRIVKHLYENGMIDRVPSAGRLLWMWHDMERTLGISRAARRLASKTQTTARAAQQSASDVSTN